MFVPGVTNQNQNGHHWSGNYQAGYNNQTSVEGITEDILSDVLSPFYGFTFPSNTELELAVRKAFEGGPHHKSTNYSYWQVASKAKRIGWIVECPFEEASVLGRAYTVVGPKADPPVDLQERVVDTKEQGGIGDGVVAVAGVDPTPDMAPAPGDGSPVLDGTGRPMVDATGKAITVADILDATRRLDNAADLDDGRRIAAEPDPEIAQESRPKAPAPVTDPEEAMWLGCYGGWWGE